MFVRRARSLVLTLPPSGLQGINFLTRRSAPCTPLSVDLLARAGDWIPVAVILDAYPPPVRALVEYELHRLIDLTCLVPAGTPLAIQDARYEAEWVWDAIAGLYHFSLKELEFLNTQEANAWLEYQAARTPAPPMFKTNRGHPQIVSLRKPDLQHGVFEFMSARRSERTFRTDAISLEALSDCLFAGLGITGFFDVPIPGHDPLPLKMAPSGGGRNPYEGYVYALRVEGLAAGIYHYSATEHSLGLVRTPPLPPPQRLLGGQEWTDNAAAIVFLVAHFRRTMWKYPHPSAYRVVLIEAGHIGQNIALVAAAHQLVAIPVAALNDTLDSEVLGVDYVTDSVVCGLVLGGRLPPGDDGPLERPLTRAVVD